MNKSMKTLIPVLAILGFSVMGGCGMTTSGDERLERAQSQMEEGDYRGAMIELKNALASDANNATARLLLAKVSLGLGDVLTAEKEVARAADLNAPESEVRPLHMEVLLAKGAFTDALAALGMETEGLTQAQQWSYRGTALLALGNTDAASATYREWLSADPASIDAAVGLADAQAASGDLDTAIASLQQIVKKAPENFAAWHVLGTALFRASDHAGAEAALIKADDKIQPQAHVFRYASILSTLVQVELILDKRDAARRNLERLTGVLPNAPMTLFLSAQLANSEGDYALASRHLQALLNIAPDNSRAQLFLASTQMMQGNFAQAERLLQRVVATEPDNLQARKLLAQLQLRQSQPGGAVEALTPLLEDANDADVYTMLAQASMQQGNSAKAIESLRAAVALDPNDVNAKLNLASAYLNAGMTDLALETLGDVREGTDTGYRRERLLMAALVADDRQAEADAIVNKLLAGDKLDSRATSVIADYYVQTDRIDDARKIIEEFVAENPNESDAKNALARLEFADGNTDAATKLFTAVLDSDENNMIALMGLARIEHQAENTVRMVALLQQAANAHRKAAEPRVILAGHYLQAGDLAEAENAANELVAIGVRNAYASNVIAKVFLEAGRSEEALSHFQQAAVMAPESPQIQMGLARTYLVLDRPDDARTALQRALEISPGWPTAMTVLTLVEMRQGRMAEAQQLVAEFRTENPDDVAGMVLEGEVYLALEDHARAAKAFGEAVDAGAGRSAVLREYQARVGGSLPQADATLTQWLDDHPDDLVARSYLAQHYQRAQQSELAVTEYEKVLAKNPNNALVLNNLAWLYQQDGDLDRAVELAERANEIDSSMGPIADTLGWIYYDRGELDKSLKFLTVASSLSPDNGEIQYHYAVALSAAGDKDKARRILEKLTESDTSFSSRQLAEELLKSL